MGRTKGSTNKTNGKDHADTPAPGDNSAKFELTDDERRALTLHHKRHYIDALSHKKAADAAFKNICKKAKAECGPHAVTNIKDLIALDEPGGEAELRAEVERKLQMARWCNSVVGTQFGMFDADRTPSVDRAFEAGKVAGMSGESRNPPHDPSVPQYHKWLEGWNEGQGTLARAFAKKPVDQPAEMEAEDTSHVPFAPPEEVRTPA